MALGQALLCDFSMEVCDVGVKRDVRYVTLGFSLKLVLDFFESYLYQLSSAVHLGLENFVSARSSA